MLFETREKGHWQKIQFTTGYVPNRETEEVGRERDERKRERERMKNLSFFHSLSSPPRF